MPLSPRRASRLFELWVSSAVVLRRGSRQTPHHTCRLHTSGVTTATLETLPNVAIVHCSLFSICRGCFTSVHLLLAQLPYHISPHPGLALASPPHLPPATGRRVYYSVEPFASAHFARHAGTTPHFVWRWRVCCSGNMFESDAGFTI